MSRRRHVLLLTALVVTLTGVVSAVLLATSDPEPRSPEPAEPARAPRPTADERQPRRRVDAPPRAAHRSHVDGADDGAPPSRTTRRRPGRIAGTVLGPDGEALPGRVVRYRVRGRPQSETAQVVTNAAGRFEVTGLERANYDIEVAAGGEPGAYHLGGWKNVVAHRDGEVTFELEPGVPFEGRVLDPDGAPVGGASVSAKPYRRSGGTSRALTDEEGRFAVIVQPAKAYTLLVDTPTGGLTGNRYLRWFSLDLTADGTWHEIRLEPGTHVAGTLTGAVREGVRLEVWNMLGNWRKYKLAAAMTTDENGRFRANGLWEKREYGIFLAPDDPRCERLLLLGGRARSGAEDVQLELVSSVPLAGRVVDSRRDPFRELSVRVYDPERGLAIQGKLDADGRFELQVPPGMHPLQVYVPYPIARRRGWYTVGEVRGGDEAAFVIAGDWPRK